MNNLPFLWDCPMTFSRIWSLREDCKHLFSNRNLQCVYYISPQSIPNLLFLGRKFTILAPDFLRTCDFSAFELLETKGNLRFHKSLIIELSGNLTLKKSSSLRFVLTLRSKSGLVIVALWVNIGSSSKRNSKCDNILMSCSIYFSTVPTPLK